MSRKFSVQPVDPRQLMLPFDQPESIPAISQNAPLLAPPSDMGKPAGMLRRIEMGGRSVEFALCRSKRRTIGFLVNDAGLRVTAPNRTSLSEIEDAIRSKQRWILSKLDQCQERLSAPSRRPHWRDGTELPFLGRTLILRRRDGLAEKVSLANDSDELSVSLPSGSADHEVRDCVKEWMMQEAKHLFSERTPMYADKLGVTCQSIALSSAFGRWGSCSVSGKIRLNWRLIHFSVQIIDYVIVHELSHLHEMNHGPRFWSIVCSVCPEYGIARKHLTEQAPAVFSLF